MVVLDSTVIINALIEPRRKKVDSIKKEQARLHKIATDIVNGSRFIVPTACLFEVACVCARMTGKEEIGIRAANYVNSIASEVVSEAMIKDTCIRIAAAVKSSGFDSLFIACAKSSDAELITDDRKMFEAAINFGVRTKLLRNM